MALHDRDCLVLDGLSILGDPRPSPAQPVIDDGIHLRWAFGPKRAFPLHGYHLFRRVYGEPGEHCLTPYIGAAKPGRIVAGRLDTPLGSFTGESLTATDDFDPAGSAELSLDGQGVRFFPPQGTVASRVVVTIGFSKAIPAKNVAVVAVTAFNGVTLVAETKVQGTSGAVVSAALSATAGITQITAGGPGVLIDLCYWILEPATAGLPGTSVPIGEVRRRASIPPAVAVPGPWAAVAGFPYPLLLPIRYPTYPAASGAETLSASRASGTQRIHYGTVADSLPASALVPGAGTLVLTPGSALARGIGTSWDESLVGKMLYPTPGDTAFAIMTVPAPDRMVLSRPYSGTATSQSAYALADEDVFAQVHDQLGVVLSDPAGMRAAVMPPVFDQSDAGRWIMLADGSASLSGVHTSWTADLTGLLIQVASTGDVYRIIAVDAPDQILTLHASYTGPDGQSGYRIVSRSPNNRIEESPAISFSPLDLLEFASLSPAYAQLLGLYWNDRSAESGRTYDYIILADQDGLFHEDGAQALRWVNNAPDFDHGGVDGSVLTSIQHVGSGALPAPSTLDVFALPAGSLRMDLDRPDLADTEAGLSIGDFDLWASLPSARQPLFLEAWRAGHGVQMPPPGTPPNAQAYTSTGDRFRPSRRPAATEASPSIPGWPDPALIHYIDAGDGDGLDVGWYSYRVSAGDIWGRFSALSPPIPWHRAADNAELHPYAVHLDDTTPPPPPTDLMAWVLEPANVKDAGRIEDEAYVTWRNLVGPAARGLRLRWRWPWSLALRAPDLEEFRIYRQSTPLNARFHHIVSVAPSAADPTRSDVTLAEGDSAANGVYLGALLQIDERAYPIEGSTAGANLVLRVRNGGPLGGEPPPAGGDATIVLPTGHPLHRDLFDPLQWESWLAAVAEKAPSNATVTYGVDTLEDPDIITFEDANNPRQGQAAQWNQSVLTIGDLPTGVLLDDVRPGIDVIALASDAQYAVLEIASTGPGVNVLHPVIPALSSLASGTYRWSIGPAERLLWGNGGKWTTAGRTFDLPRQPNMSRIRPGLDRVYLRVGASTPEMLDHFFDVDSVDAVNHRLILRGNLALLNDNTLYEWRVGTPSRVYEMFLPSDASGVDDPQLDGWLKASLADPVVYATLGVSAADKRIEHADVRPGRTPPRHGNEGRLGGPATIFAVQRAQPDIPAEVTWGSAKLLATKAGYDGKSHFTVRWSKPDPVKLPHYRGIVFRSLDQTLFLVDWQHKRTLNLQSLTPSPFPAAWPAARQALAALELEGPAYVSNLAAPAFADAATFYSALSDDAVMVLANVPDNEDAFAQITIDPLPLIDLAQADRLGPDDDKATFPGPNASLNAWLDTFDGRSQNRYLYKVAFIDSAQNRGPLGKSTPPVYLPKVVPPRAPVITKVLGGNSRSHCNGQQTANPIWPNIACIGPMTAQRATTSDAWIIWPRFLPAIPILLLATPTWSGVTQDCSAGRRSSIAWLQSTRRGTSLRPLTRFRLGSSTPRFRMRRRGAPRSGSCCATPITARNRGRLTATCRRTATRQFASNGPATLPVQNLP